MASRLTAASVLASCQVLAGCPPSHTARDPDPAERLGRGHSLVEAIVYTTLRPPNFDLFLFEAAGVAPRRLTRDDAMDYNAAFSPDGRWIVFTSERAGNADLFALDLESGKAPVRLTLHPAMDDAAAFSPDGSRLAFVSTREGNADVFVMPFRPRGLEADASALNLTRRPGGDFNPAFSPDGGRIAYSRQEELWGGEAGDGRQQRRDFVTAVYLMNADGSDARRVTEPGTAFRAGGLELGWAAGSPAWALDGSALYYHAVGGDGPEIRRCALDGSGDITVADSGLAPAVGANGRIAFTRLQRRVGMDEWDAVTRTGRIFSVTAEGAALRAESDDRRPCFAADLDRRSGRMVCHGPAPVEDLPVIDVPGGGWAFAPPGARQTVELPDRVVEVIAIRGWFPGLTAAGDVVSTLFHQGAPGPLAVTSIDGTGARTLFSRDGALVWGTSVARDAGWAVTAVGPPFASGEANVEIWKVPLDGSAAVNLTADRPGNHALPHVSADGRQIVFRSGGDGAGTIHIMNGDGGGLRRLGDSSAIETMPALSPDGEWVVFSTTRANGRKLWLERVDGTQGRFLEPDRLDIPDLSLHPRFSPDGKWVVFTSNRAGFNDEWTSAWFPQAYGELYAVPVAGGPAHRLTHNKWEDGPNDWGRVAIPARMR